MLKNYLLISLRFINKNKGYSLVNILGLSFALAASMFIYLYIISELNFDKHWKDSDRIYRVSQAQTTSGSETRYALSGGGVAPSFKSNFPEVEDATRIIYNPDKVAVKSGESIFELEKVWRVDPNFLSFFGFKLTTGDDKSLGNAESVVISPKVASLFFGSKSAIGQTLEVGGSKYFVSGVFAKQDGETHLNPDMLLSTRGIPDTLMREYEETWVWLRAYTYVKLGNSNQLPQVKERVKGWTTKVLDPWLKQYQRNTSIEFVFTPLEKLHLTTDQSFDLSIATNPRYLYAFGIIGFFLLAIGGINYINLSTAKITARIKEVSVKKILGSQRRDIAFQIVTEIFISSFIATFLAVFLVEIFLNSFNGLTGKALESITVFSLSSNNHFLLFALIIMLLISLTVGLIPAWLISKIPTNAVLNYGQSGGLQMNKGKTIRKVLVVGQQFLALLVVFCTITIYLQLRYISNHNPGFNKEGLMVVNLPKFKEAKQYTEAFRQELTNSTTISTASACRNMPGYYHGALIFYYKGKESDEQKTINLFAVDNHFPELFELKLQGGRFFDANPAAEENSILISEAAAKSLGWDSTAVGKYLISDYTPQGKIVGVFKDIYYESLHLGVDPLAIIFKPSIADKVVFRIKPGDISGAVDHLKNTWGKFYAGYPLEYSFLDASFEKQYGKEKKMLSLFLIFSVLMVAIAGLGLFSLAGFTATARRREVAIRKVFGATSARAVAVLSYDFAIWLGIACLLAIPAGYYVSNLWLEEFTQKITIGFWIPVLVVVVGFAVAAIAVVGQLWDAAGKNPSDILKNE